METWIISQKKSFIIVTNSNYRNLIIKKTVLKTAYELTLRKFIAATYIRDDEIS